jgi:SAM-dependent methyltransferase
MSESIINLQQWFQTPPGEALLGWEQAQLDEAVADVFGYHALQLGLPQIAALQANRMPHQWLADRAAGASSTEPKSPLSPQSPTSPPSPESLALPSPSQLLCDFESLPFPEASLDLLVMPHTLEFSRDPHASLREAERVLVPEGRVVITGFNPTSLWGWKQRRARLWQRLGVQRGPGRLYLPDAGEFLGYFRLRDWLRLLGFEVEASNFGLWQPAVRSEGWLYRFDWMNALGERYWPIFGAAYCVVAVKRVRGMRLMGPAWKKAPRASSAPVSVAPRSLGRRNFRGKITENRGAFGDADKSIAVAMDARGIAERYRFLGDLDRNISAAQTPTAHFVPESHDISSKKSNEPS